MPTRRLARIACLAGLALLLTGRRTSAQYVEQPTFLASPYVAVQVDVAPATDGTMTIVTAGEFGDGIRTRQLTPSGFPLAEGQLNKDKYVGGPVIAADPRGGYVSAWLKAFFITPTTFRPGLVGQLLEHGGTGVGKDFRVSLDGDFANAPALAGLPSGSIMTWYGFPDGLRARRYTADGQPLGDPFMINESGGISSVLATPDGGFLIVYRDFVLGGGSFVPLVFLRAFDANGVPLGGATQIAEGYEFADAALSVDGTVVAAAGFFQADPDLPARDLIVTLFTPGGSVLSANIVVHSAPEGATRPVVEFDLLGNLYVAWGERSTGAPPTGVRVRGLDATGAPLGPPVWVSDKAVVEDTNSGGVHAVRLKSGSFANVWSDGTHAWATVVSLCTPGTAVCGDGLRSVTCEECDDGPGNSDTAPDACRTDCRHARCGDGVVDGGEECDDGNQRGCDGCSTDCTIEPGPVCGDGIVSPGCEECDDANAVAGDGCSPTCGLERAPGGGSPVTDCLAEWRIDNPANEPLHDRRGAISNRQRCVDNDPRCDFDGGAIGTCTFHVAVCANNTNVAGCASAGRLAGWVLAKPSQSQADRDPVLAAVRATLGDSVPAAIVGPSAPNICSDMTSIVLPLRGVPGDYRSGKLKLVTRAETYSGATDSDTLKLACVPATP